MKIEEQSELDRIIHSIFQREDIVDKIEKGERIKTNYSLEGWVDFAFSNLPSSVKYLLDDAEIAHNIYKMFEGHYQKKLENVGNQ